MVRYRDTDGKSHNAETTYEQDKKPQRTKVISDLVPRGCTTTKISIIKKSR